MPATDAATSARTTSTTTTRALTLRGPSSSPTTRTSAVPRTSAIPTSGQVIPVPETLAARRGLLDGQLDPDVRRRPVVPGRHAEGVEADLFDGCPCAGDVRDGCQVRDRSEVDVHGQLRLGQLGQRGLHPRRRAEVAAGGVLGPG